MTVFIVVSFETHFTGVVSGVQSNIRLERAFSDPDEAEKDVKRMQGYNPGTRYSIERLEVR